MMSFVPASHSISNQISLAPQMGSQYLCPDNFICPPSHSVQPFSYSNISQQKFEDNSKVNQKGSEFSYIPSTNFNHYEITPKPYEEFLKDLSIKVQQNSTVQKKFSLEEIQNEYGFQSQKSDLKSATTLPLKQNDDSVLNIRSVTINLVNQKKAQDNLSQPPQLGQQNKLQKSFSLNALINDNFQKQSEEIESPPKKVIVHSRENKKFLKSILKNTPKSMLSSASTFNTLESSFSKHMEDSKNQQNRSPFSFSPSSLQFELPSPFQLEDNVNNNFSNKNQSSPKEKSILPNIRLLHSNRKVQFSPLNKTIFVDKVSFSEKIETLSKENNQPQKNNFPNKYNHFAAIEDTPSKQFSHFAVFHVENSPIKNTNYKSANESPKESQDQNSPIQIQCNSPLLSFYKDQPISKKSKIYMQASH